jgi:hypothetical protein
VCEDGCDGEGCVLPDVRMSVSEALAHRFYQVVSMVCGQVFWYGAYGVVARRALHPVA